MSQTIHKLNIYYYGMMALAVVAAVGSYFLIMHEIISPINPYTTLGQVLQYIVIFDALITIPGGLYWFKHQCQKMSQIEDPTIQNKQYGKYAAIRIVLVSNAMILGIIAFYIMGAYQSMIWVAAISAIGWYFTKPSVAKMKIELTPRDPNVETY